MKQSLNIQTIKQALKSKGYTQLAIAKMLKVNPVCVHEIITGKRKNPRIRLAVALAIGKPVSEIWPDAKPSTEEKSA